MQIPKFSTLALVASLSWFPSTFVHAQCGLCAENATMQFPEKPIEQNEALQNIPLASFTCGGVDSALSIIPDILCGTTTDPIVSNPNFNLRYYCGCEGEQAPQVCQFCPNLIVDAIVPADSAFFANFACGYVADTYFAFRSAELCDYAAVQSVCCDGAGGVPTLTPGTEEQPPPLFPTLTPGGEQPLPLVPTLTPGGDQPPPLFPTLTPGEGEQPLPLVPTLTPGVPQITDPAVIPLPEPTMVPGFSGETFQPSVSVIIPLPDGLFPTMVPQIMEGLPTMMPVMGGDGEGAMPPTTTPVTISLPDDAMEATNPPTLLTPFDDNVTTTTTDDNFIAVNDTSFDTSSPTSTPAAAATDDGPTTTTDDEVVSGPTMETIPPSEMPSVAGVDDDAAAPTAAPTTGRVPTAGSAAASTHGFPAARTTAQWWTGILAGIWFVMALS